jgi:hypothetical protein
MNDVQRKVRPVKNAMGKQRGYTKPGMGFKIPPR